MPTLILIAGPNGAGKTTFAREILTSDLKGMRFINADEIARGLSPFNPDSVALKAGRILLKEVAELIANQTSFALESTVSGRVHAHTLEKAREAGYRIVIHFLWLPSPLESIARVKLRVKKGGHFSYFEGHPAAISAPAPQPRASLPAPRSRMDLLGCAGISASGLGKFAQPCYLRRRSFRPRPMIAPQYKPLRPLKASELSEHGQVALRAHRRAARKLRAEHRMLGLPIIVWENGRVVEKAP